VTSSSVPLGSGTAAGVLDTGLRKTNLMPQKSPQSRNPIVVIDGAETTKILPMPPGGKSASDSESSVREALNKLPINGRCGEQAGFLGWRAA
jgi:hypothetical protein